MIVSTLLFLTNVTNITIYCVLETVHSPVSNWSFQASSSQGVTAVIHGFLFVHSATLWVQVEHFNRTPSLRGCWAIRNTPDFMLKYFIVHFSTGTSWTLSYERWSLDSHDYSARHTQGLAYKDKIKTSCNKLHNDYNIEHKSCCRNYVVTVADKIYYYKYREEGIHSWSAMRVLQGCSKCSKQPSEYTFSSTGPGEGAHPPYLRSFIAWVWCE